MLDLIVLCSTTNLSIYSDTDKLFDDNFIRNQ
jgi:hypothetical protein